MESVDKYIASLDEPQKNWIALLVNFMGEVFPEVKVTLGNKKLIYEGIGYFIGFAAQKNRFVFSTDDNRVLSLLKEQLPSSTLGKSSVKIKYDNEYGLDCMMDACKEIVDYHKAMEPPTISDIKALKKWRKIPQNMQQIIIDNVYCSKCGVTTIVDYGIQNDRFGVVLNGYCQKCGARVARMVEDC